MLTELLLVALVCWTTCDGMATVTGEPEFLIGSAERRRSFVVDPYHLLYRAERTRLIPHLITGMLSCCHALVARRPYSPLLPYSDCHRSQFIVKHYFMVLGGGSEIWVRWCRNGSCKFARGRRKHRVFLQSEKIALPLDI